MSQEKRRERIQELLGKLPADVGRLPTEPDKAERSTAAAGDQATAGEQQKPPF